MNEVVRHNKSVEEQLKPGDTVEFERGPYRHYGVYAGKGKVVHLTGTGPNGRLQDHGSQHISSVSGRQFDKAEVKIDTFQKVAGNSKAYKANDLDSKISPLPRSQIVRNAKSKVGCRGYNLLTNNCEHFANRCRYEEETSGQVEAVLTGLVVGAVVVVSSIAVGYLYDWWKNKNKKQPEEYNN